MEQMNPTYFNNWLIVFAREFSAFSVKFFFVIQNKAFKDIILGYMKTFSVNQLIDYLTNHFVSNFLNQNLERASSL